MYTSCLIQPQYFNKILLDQNHSDITKGYYYLSINVSMGTVFELEASSDNRELCEWCPGIGCHVEKHYGFINHKIFFVTDIEKKKKGYNNFDFFFKLYKIHQNYITKMFTFCISHKFLLSDNNEFVLETFAPHKDCNFSM